jgi:site-specific recombinase XerD
LTQRKVSPATIAAYRDTFRLLLRYLAKSRSDRNRPLGLEALTSSQVLRFLDYLEQQRANSVRTRNARLAAIRSFVHYLSDWLAPDLPPALVRILTIPFKRQTQKLVGFLSHQEIEAILAATDSTWTGQRDHLLLLLLYNTGARISELLALRVGDVDLAGRHLELVGKGRKQRCIPLWPSTQRLLRRWLKVNRWPPEASLLPNRFGHPLSRAGVLFRLRKIVQRAAARFPALKQRRISPHTFRHSTAMALLEADVPLEVIALYLGHESPKTTHVYVEASLTMKKRALANIRAPREKTSQLHLTERELRFLESL